MIKFREKNFSHFMSDTVKGASIGAGLGTLILPFLPKDIKERESFIGSSKSVAISTLVGAALGAVIGLIRDGEQLIKRSRVDNRLMSFVIDGLKNQGFKEGTDFTRDPKKATQLKTRVCIVITKVSGEFNLLVNTVSDSKLKNITTELVKNLPNTSTYTENISDKFNDITISSISDSSVTAGLVIGICERFIRSGFPVYLIEVG